MNNNAKASAEELIAAVQKGEATLESIARKLEDESARRFGHGQAVDPVQLAKRARKLASELPTLQAECQELLTRKQALVDSAQQQLASNYARLKAVCEAAGAEAVDDAPYNNFRDALTEWNRQMLHHHAGFGGEGHMSRQDLNTALAGAALASSAYQ